MMLFPAYDPDLLQPKQDESLTRYWTSLSPFAPFFGVKWRFADAITPQAAPVAPKAKKAKKSEKPKAKVAAPVVAKTAPKEKAKAAPKPVVAKVAAEPKPAAPQVVKPKAAPKKAAEQKVAAPVVAQFKAAPKVQPTPAPVKTTAKTVAEVKPEPKLAPVQKSKPVETLKNTTATTTPPITFKSSKPKAAPAAKPAVAKAPVVKPVAAKAVSAKPDDLTMIKGIGDKLAKTLNEYGVTTFAQIANWSERDVDEFEAQFIKLPGRIAKDKWIAQAKAFSTKANA